MHVVVYADLSYSLLGGFLLQSINVALCSDPYTDTGLHYSIYNYSLGQIYDLSFLVQLPST